MKNCKDIENSLPLYAEDLLSADEKRAIEDHLAECVDCRKALTDLKKANAMTQVLSEVEPPPWFKQKIMARVRAEAEKKSFAQKWFYPLRIKIPVQIAATIVIAVLAVYIYHSGDEQMKAVLPGAQQPVMEAKQEPTPAEIPKAKKASTAFLTEKKAAVIVAVKKDKISDEVSSGGSVPEMEMQGNKLAGASDKSLAMKSNIAAEKEEKKYIELQAKQEAPQRYAAQQERIRESSVEDSSLSGAAKKSKWFKAAAPAKPRSMAASVIAQLQPNISVYVVADINSAVVEAENILAKHNARKITKQLMDGKAIMQAKLPAKNLKHVLLQLRVLGKVEEKIMPVESDERDISVVIEIKNQ
jgi:hypothetical protein